MKVSSKFIVMLIIIIISSQVNVYSTIPSDFHLIVGLPLTNNHSDPATASWERGKEILPGAQIAVESINNRGDIFPQHKLHIIVVNIGRCGDQNYNFLLQYVNATYHQKINFIGAVGIFCPTEISVVHHPEGVREEDTIPKKNLKLVVESQDHSRFLNSFPSSLMVKALLNFFKALEWRKIGIINEANNNYFSYLVETLHTVQHKSNLTVFVYNYAPNTIITNLNLPRIVLVSVSLPLATELLCSAYRGDMMWPKHVWILHTYHFETIVNVNASCDIETAMENVIIFSEMIPTFWNGNYDDYNEKYVSTISFNNSNQNIFQTNFYSLILHDLVWSVVLSVNHTYQSQSRSITKSSFNTFQQRQLSIFQVQNNTKMQVAIYSDDLNFTDLSFRQKAPSDELQVTTVGVSVAYTATFLVEIFAGFTFVTIMLIGYSCFRNEPEVKSTSFSLSLLIFLGSYLMFAYLSILLYFHQPWPTSKETLDGLCISLNWFSGLGVPNALVLVTVLVKILRIYHIFSKSMPSALSKKCSDSYLALYVMLILLPLILLHTIWIKVDPYLGFIKVSSELNSILYEKQCMSNYVMLWYALLASYILTIFLILFIAAVKMRNIQISHFNDTKKVTILVICYFIDLIVGLTCWRILYTAVNAYYAAIVLHIAHMIVIVLCQVLLIAPKVLPPFIRYLKRF